MGKSPLIVTGAHSEAILIRDFGYDAASIASRGMPALAALAERLAHESRSVIALVAPEMTKTLMDACLAAGTPVRVPTPFVLDTYAKAVRNGDDAAIHRVIKGEVAEAARSAESDAEAAREAQYRMLGLHDVLSVALDIVSTAVDSDPVPTGLDALDNALGGGLPLGALTVLGAGSSSGKTTLAVQIADHMASSGRPVMIVTIEQGRHELVAKSLSRMMRLTRKVDGGWYVASSADILRRSVRETWPAGQTDALLRCAADYVDREARQLTILETTEQPSVGSIRRAAEVIARRMGVAPVIIIDYLQLLASPDERMDARRCVDRNVSDLRCAAKDMATSIVAISSISRDAYYQGADLGGFKESGGIEYGCDCALILQPRSWGNRVAARGKGDREARADARDAMAAHRGSTIREVEIAVLKNRNGRVPAEPIPLEYDAMCNLFTCATASARPARPERVVI